MNTPIDDDDHDDAPALPDRAVLDAWTVPPAAPDLTDRVLTHVEAEPSLRTVIPLRSRRGGRGLAVVGVAMVAAAALVLGLAQLWRPAPAEEAAVSVASVEPAPSAEPALVAAPLPERPTPREEPALVDPPDAPTPPSDAERSPAPEVEIPFIRPEPKPEAKPKPKPDANQTATLRIGTERGRSWANVYVDGKHVGATPVMNVKVTPGRHTVKWVWAKDDVFTTTVTLKAGQTLVLKGPLREPTEP